jgi:hypothetical protein
MGFQQRIAEFAAKLAEPKRPPIAQEFGGTGTSFFKGYIKNDEFNASLKGTKAAATYDKMRRTDAQIAAILSVMMLPIV